MSPAMILTILAIMTLFALAYRQARLVVWTFAAVVFLGLWQWQAGQFSTPAWVVLGVIALLLNFKPLRRHVLSKSIMAWFRKVLPPMSATEKTAIDAGTVWWDGALFSGKPDWNRLLRYPKPELTDEEHAFVEGPVDTLCQMVDDWRINHELNDLPPEIWQYIKENGFLGMIIPKEYGGLGFSARAHSEVVMKIATRSPTTAVTVMVPNSLGPGELLLEYGTDAQKDHYLPRLARGDEMPCFALTSPYAGSDAGAIPDSGIVCLGMHEGQETLGLKLNWDKRYITLAPVATVLGLAFKAYDPDGLLGEEKSLGITCALIPTNTPGVEIGNRHNPMAAFQNGPTRGRDVFIPLDWIIGGPEMIGQGWRMLVESLSVGRSISLPAYGTGTGKLSARLTGAYARIRKQFGMPIGRFEGVEEVLARIAGVTYRMDAARCMTTGALDLGERPSVLSAILKYHLTEGMRTTINDALDIHGGRGVCIGPRNYLANVYSSTPVAITVEGANILTRSMIIFGQGAIRCHPYILKEMRAAASDDLKTFDDALFAHIGFAISNKVRTFVLGLTAGRVAATPRTGPTRHYYRQLSRMSAAFAFIADTTMLLLGGELKRRERISARLGDVLSHLYMASAVLKRHEDQGRPAADLAFVDWALQDSLYTIQTRLEQVLENFPVPVVGRLLKWVVFPLGRSYRGPSDRTIHRAAELLLEPSAARDRLTEGMFVTSDPADPFGLIERTLEQTLITEPILRKIKQAAGLNVKAYDPETPLRAALDSGVINDMEAQTVRDWAALVREAIAVDEFAPQREGIATKPVEYAQTG